MSEDLQGFTKEEMDMFTRPPRMKNGNIEIGYSAENIITTGSDCCKMGYSKSVDEVLQERGERYGKFINNANVAQELKYAMRIDTNFDKLSADKREALDQIVSKISRIVTANASEYKDSWTDIEGYAKLVSDTLND